MTSYFLPQSEYISVTPELICRILDTGHLHPGHEEGDISFTVDTEEFAEYMRKLGFKVMIGYQQWGTVAQEQQQQEGAEQ
jgi:hypothetical protein